MNSREFWSLYLIFHAVAILAAAFVAFAIGWTWMGILGLCIGLFVFWLGLQ